MNETEVLKKKPEHKEDYYNLKNNSITLSSRKANYLCNQNYIHVMAQEPVLSNEHRKGFT